MVSLPFRSGTLAPQKLTMKREVIPCVTLPIAGISIAGVVEATGDAVRIAQ